MQDPFPGRSLSQKVLLISSLALLGEVLKEELLRSTYHCWNPHHCQKATSVILHHHQETVSATTPHHRQEVDHSWTPIIARRWAVPGLVIITRRWIHLPGGLQPAIHLIPAAWPASQFPAAWLTNYRILVAQPASLWILAAWPARHWILTDWPTSHQILASLSNPILVTQPATQWILAHPAKDCPAQVHSQTIST